MSVPAPIAPAPKPIDACTVDRLRAVLVVGRDALDPARGTILHCDRASFRATHAALHACVRHLVPLGSHPVTTRPNPEVRTVADLLRLLDDAYARLRMLVLSGRTAAEPRARMVRALAELNAAITDLLRVVGEAATIAAQARAA